MGQTDKQFNTLLRMMIARLKAAFDEPNPEKSKQLIREILDDLQAALED